MFDTHYITNLIKAFFLFLFEHSLTLCDSILFVMEMILGKGKIYLKTPSISTYQGKSEYLP